MDISKKLVRLKVSDLIPYERNPRKIPQEAIDDVCESYRQCGVIDPIEIDEDNVILSGHTRRLAALEMGIDKVDCLRVQGLTDDQKRKYRVLANKTGERSTWDYDLLAAEIDELDFGDYDFDFEIPDIDEEFSKEDIKEDNYEPNVPDEPKAKRGDIYQLGRHRLMCGDSTSEEDVAQLMGDDHAHVLFTSPPYSDMREYEGGKDLNVSNIAQFIKTYRPYVNYQCINLGIQRKNHDIVEYWDEYIRIARESGYKMLAWNVWDKGETGSIGNQSAFIPIRHEWIFVFGTSFYEINKTIEKKPDSINVTNHHHTVRCADGSTKIKTVGDTSSAYKQMESVCRCSPVKQNDIRAMHPATFPVELPSEYIKAMTIWNDIVIEPFGGSGTTLIACEQLGRQCRVMELEPKYIDVIIDRWEQFTGKQAVLLNG